MAVLTERQKAIYYKANLPNYLKTLGVLFQREVVASELLSLKESELLGSRYKKKVLIAKDIYETTIPDVRYFDFNQLFAALQAAASTPACLWADLSDACGYMKVDSLLNIKSMYAFLVFSNICAFETRDLNQRLLIDYTEHSDGSNSLMFEVEGEEWQTAFKSLAVSLPLKPLFAGDSVY